VHKHNAPNALCKAPNMLTAFLNISQSFIMQYVTLTVSGAYIPQWFNIKLCS